MSAWQTTTIVTAMRSVLTQIRVSIVLVIQDSPEVDSFATVSKSELERHYEGKPPTRPNCPKSERNLDNTLMGRMILSKRFII